MPHIHEGRGQVDFTVGVFVVCGDRVLYRFHDKVHKWLVPGGHIELNEVPEQAALREVFEEVGLRVTLYNPDGLTLATLEEDSEQIGRDDYRELLAPVFMQVHPLSESHRHVESIYFAHAETMETSEPEGVEKSGGLLWLTREELETHPDILPIMKQYGLRALELLAS